VPSELKLWDTASGKEQWVLHGGPGDVHSIAFSPDSGAIVCPTMRLSASSALKAVGERESAKRNQDGSNMCR
jgi:WD40 repeat protein